MSCIALYNKGNQSKKEIYMKDSTASFTFRIPVQLREELQKRADQDGRSLSNYIIYVLQKSIQEKGMPK